MWNMERADQQFSRFIRRRDGRCMNPMCPNGLSRHAEVAQLECSHYYGRGILISRFDPDNCMALCHTCHSMWEHTKEKRYKEVMIRWLGAKKWRALKKRVEDYKNKNIPYLNDNMAIKACREFLTKHKNATATDSIEYEPVPDQ